MYVNETNHTGQLALTRGCHDPPPTHTLLMAHADFSRRWSPSFRQWEENETAKIVFVGYRENLRGLQGF